jgi:hypothetical protein
MKRFIILCLLIPLCCLSCKKAAVDTTDVLVHNATYSVNSLTSEWNGSSIGGAALAPGQTSGAAGMPYIVLPAGVNRLVLGSGTASLLDKHVYASPGSHYSLLVYDTSATTASPVTAFITDDLGLPDTGAIKYRFLYCVPDANSVNLVMLRAAGNDTIARGMRFIGKDPAAISTGSFTAIRYDTATLQVIDAVSRQKMAEITGLPLPRQGIFSFIYSGKPGGTPLLSVIKNK